jgi:hypothetical protein
MRRGWEVGGKDREKQRKRGMEEGSKKQKRTL